MKLTTTLFALLLLMGCKNPPGAILTASTGTITGIVLIDGLTCEDVPYFNQWIDSLPDKQFLVILACCSDPTSAPIQELKQKHNAKVFFDYASFNCTVTAPAGINDKSHKGKKTNQFGGGHVNTPPSGTYDPNGAPQIVFPSPQYYTTAYFTEDLFVTSHEIQRDGSVRHTVYVAALSPSDTLTADIKAVCGADTVIYTLGAPHQLQGGNHFMTGNHLLVGYTYLDPTIDSTHGVATIRSFYDLMPAPNVSLDFIGVQHDDLLYHLDLIFTTTGADSHGVWQFYVAQIPPSLAAADDSTVAIGLELDMFAAQLSTLLAGYYPTGNYHITRVPVYASPANGFVISGLNGIVDYTGGATKYYFPWVSPQSPVLTQTSSGLGSTDVQMLTAIQAQALDTFRLHLGAANVRAFNMPPELVIDLSSQSLHCTMGVVMRKD